MVQTSPAVWHGYAGWCGTGSVVRKMSKVVVSMLAPVTVLQLTLIHIDHAVPPRCVNVLDLGTKYGECEELLRSGVFTCEHDFCPDCDDARRRKAHQCDLSCGYCPEQALPCPTPEEGAPCVNRLDLRCVLLPVLRCAASHAGSASCLPDALMQDRGGPVRASYRRGHCELRTRFLLELRRLHRGPRRRRTGWPSAWRV